MYTAEAPSELLALFEELAGGSDTNSSLAKASSKGAEATPAHACRGLDGLFGGLRAPYRCRKISYVLVHINPLLHKPQARRCLHRQLKESGLCASLPT
jgi:hypothetical protein